MLGIFYSKKLHMKDWHFQTVHFVISSIKETKSQNFHQLKISCQLPKKLKYDSIIGSRRSTQSSDGQCKNAQFVSSGGYFDGLHLRSISRVRQRSEHPEVKAPVDSILILDQHPQVVDRPRHDLRPEVSHLESAKGFG